MMMLRPSSSLALPLAACLLLLAARPPARGQAPAPKPGPATNAADRAACERQLNRISGALQEYRKQHDNKLPAKLSDLLTPELIHDPDDLVCPFVQKRGGLRAWKKRVNELSPDPYTSYGYEFAPVLMDYNPEMTRPSTSVAT